MIALYKGTSWMSRAIRWRTWSDYSHAAWVREDGSVIEAWTNGVRCVTSPLDDHTPGTPIDFFDVAITPDQRRQVEAFLMWQLGKPYDHTAILGFLTRAKSENPDRWFCSELVFAACKSAGVELLKRIPAWKVCPGTLSLSPMLSEVRR